MKKGIVITSILIVVFLAGVLTNYYWLSSSRSSSRSNQKIAYWVSPMNPAYRSNKPGKDLMGMNLVPVYENQINKGNIVTISPNVENDLGVKTEEIRPRDLSRVIHTVGYVTVDENNIEHVQTYTDGWIRTLKVKTTEELVHKGQLLLDLYSPTLNNAQEELLLALKNHNASLIAAGKIKLETLGMSQSQIKQLVQTKKTMNTVQIYAAEDGIVSSLNIRQGQYVKPMMNLMTIEDLSQVWVIAEVFQRQSDWVKVGQDAVATLPYLPGKSWQGKVDYVYPELNGKTHTLRARLVFQNPDLMLKPNMYADVKILSQTIKNTLAIPFQALIRTGSGDRVVLSLGGGQFKVLPVKIGIESDHYYQVLSGLKAGAVVVTSAQFLIDSESNLQAELSRMQSPKPSTTKKKK